MAEAIWSLCLPDPDDCIFLPVLSGGGKESGVFRVNPIPSGRSATTKEISSEQKQAKASERENGRLRFMRGHFIGVERLSGEASVPRIDHKSDCFA